MSLLSREKDMFGEGTRRFFEVKWAGFQWSCTRNCSKRWGQSRRWFRRRQRRSLRIRMAPRQLGSRAASLIGTYGCKLVRQLKQNFVRKTDGFGETENLQVKKWEYLKVKFTVSQRTQEKSYLTLNDNYSILQYRIRTLTSCFSEKNRISFDNYKYWTYSKGIWVNSR